MKKIFLLTALIVGFAGLGQEYSGGIETATGFKVNDPQPIDDRYVVEDSASLHDLPNVYEGLTSYSEAESALFVYDGVNWNRLAKGGDLSNYFTKSETRDEISDSLANFNIGSLIQERFDYDETLNPTAEFELVSTPTQVQRVTITNSDIYLDDSDYSISGNTLTILTGILKDEDIIRIDYWTGNSNSGSYSKLESDQRFYPNQSGLDLEEVVSNIADGTGGKAYPDLTTAMAVDPLPDDGVIFTIDESNETEKGIYAYDSTEVNGYRFVRGFADGEVQYGDSRAVSGGAVAKVLSNNIDGNIVIGAIATSDGSDTGGDTRLRTQDYLKNVSEISIETEDVLIYYAFYYLDENYVSRVTVEAQNYDVVYPENTNEVRFSFKKTDGSPFSSNELNYVIKSKELIDFPELIEISRSSSTVVNDYNLTKINVQESDIEFGGIGTSDGIPSSYNVIRIRTADFIPLILNQNYVVEEVPEGYVIVKIYKYLNGVFVGNMNASNGTIITPDETFNEVKFSFSKTDSNEEITNEEKNSFSFSLTTSYTGILLSEMIPKIPEIEKRVENIEEQQGESPFNGLKMASLGDSITYGFVPRNDPDYPGQLDSYAKLCAEALGMTFENYGISGSTLGAIEEDTTERSPFVYRYDNLPDDADVITVMGGTNDIRQGIPLGVFSDTVETTYYGALHVLCEGILNKYRIEQGTEVGKDKIIVFLTPIKMGTDINQEYNGHTLADYAEAVKEVCAYYSIPVFDAYNLSGITPHILRTVEGTEPGYTDFYNPYITDGTHPTQDGQEIFARAFTGFLKTLK